MGNVRQKHVPHKMARPDSVNHRTFGDNHHHVLIGNHKNILTQGTVGTEISVSHLAPTPVGMTVRCISRLCAVNGRELIFEIEAYDEMSLIARAIHKRFIIQNDRFMDKALRRKTMPQQD